jgi:hypothetical protein
MNNVTNAIQRSPSGFFTSACIAALVFAPVSLGASTTRELPHDAGVSVAELVEYWPDEGLVIAYSMVERITPNGRTKYDLIGTVVESLAIPVGSSVQLLDIGAAVIVDTCFVSPTQAELRADGAVLGVISRESRTNGQSSFCVGGSAAGTLCVTTDPAAWTMLGDAAPTLSSVLTLLLAQGGDQTAPNVPCDPTRKEAMQDAKDVCTHGVIAFSYSCDRATGSVSYSFECQRNPTPEP